MSEATKKWFLLQAGEVQGPWTPEELENLLPTATEPQVWGRGMAEWMKPEEWRAALRTEGSALSEQVAAADRVWRYRSLSGKEQGPFTYDVLLTHLKSLPDYGDIQVLGEGFSEWRDVYDVQKLVDELGISRRTHQRVPIMGTLTIEMPEGPRHLKVTSISEGGVGLTEAENFPVGETFKGTLSSPNLFQEIPCTGEVVYAGPDGSAGVRFLQIPADAQAAVVEYVRKFADLGNG